MIEHLPRLRFTASAPADAAIICAASLVVAVVLDLFITRVVKRLVAGTRTDLDDRVISLLHRPVFYTALLAGVALALVTLEAPPVFFLLVQTLLALTWVATALRLSAALYDRLPGALSRETSAGRHFGPLLRNLTTVVLVGIGVAGILSIWRINVTPLLASAGIAGAAVAFASKDTIANFLGGMSILTDRPYSVGHYIVLDSGERGEVVDIGLRSTRIQTRDDVQVVIPNAVMATAKIVNESAPVPRFRVRIPVGVAYGTDVETVERILLAAAKENPGVETTPEPRVRFRAFGDSALQFELLCWVDAPGNRGRITHELNTTVYRRFAEAGVTIPFPQRDVHLHK